MSRGRHGRDRMVVGFTTTCAITTNVVISNPVRGKVHSIQHYVIKFASDLRQVGDFLRFPPPIKPPRYNWNSVESGVKHHKPKPKNESSIMSINSKYRLFQSNRDIFLFHAFTEFSFWWTNMCFWVRKL